MESKSRVMLSQLRHAYAQLMAGQIKNQEAFAKGLLGPVIEHFEELLDNMGIE